MEYSLLKLSFKALFPSKISSQKSVKAPLFIFHLKFDLLNWERDPPIFSIPIMSFIIPEAFLLTVSSSRPLILLTSYLSLIYTFQLLSFSLYYLWNHFPSRAKFFSSRELKLKPPFLFGRQTSFQTTMCIFFLTWPLKSSKLPQKNVLLIPSNWLLIPYGTLFKLN